MIEYNNLTTGEVGALDVPAARDYAEKSAEHDWEVMAWFGADEDTADAFKLVTGEQSIAACVAIADWCEANIDGHEYVALTDSELEAYADERLNSYIDECILTEIPENLRFYFDADAWKRDAKMSDGIEHCAGLAEVYDIDTDAGKVRVLNLYTQA